MKKKIIIELTKEQDFLLTYIYGECRKLHSERDNMYSCVIDYKDAIENKDLAFLCENDLVEQISDNDEYIVTSLGMKYLLT